MRRLSPILSTLLVILIDLPILFGFSSRRFRTLSPALIKIERSRCCELLIAIQKGGGGGGGGGGRSGVLQLVLFARNITAQGSTIISGHLRK